jgi:hypothetical protein
MHAVSTRATPDESKEGQDAAVVLHVGLHMRCPLLLVFAFSEEVVFLGLV